MRIEVHVATMNQNDYKLLGRMNIQSDAIIANQSDRNEVEELTYKEHNVKYLSFAERGVGLNRNNALMRSEADICLLADDDLVFVDDYPEMVKKGFKDNPDADVIIFNLIEKDRQRYVIKKRFNVGYLNYMRFGAARIAFRRRSVTKHGISFNLHFGGGADYSAGEDTLFLKNCLAKGLKIVALPEYIATLDDSRDSTWFTGYNNKFFIDRGALFFIVSPRWAWLLCLQFSIRRRKMFREEKTWLEVFKLMLKGIQEMEKMN